MEKEYIKNFDKWNEYVKKLNERESPIRFSIREIWWCALGVNIGSEQDGKNDDFERPVLIIRRINNEMIWVVPITSNIKIHSERITIELLGDKSQLLLQQTKMVSSKRLLRKISVLKLTSYLLVIISLIRSLSLPLSQSETPH